MRIQADQTAGHGPEVTSDDQAQAMLQQVAGAIGATNPEILQSAIAAWSAHALGDAGAMLLASTLQKVAGALESAGAERSPTAAAVDGAKATKAARAAKKPKAAGVVKKAKAPKGKAPKAAGKSRAIKTQTVKSGDTLWDIARKSGVSLQSLIAANRQIKNPDLIFPGDKIKIPKGGRPARDRILRTGLDWSCSSLPARITVTGDWCCLATTRWTSRRGPSVWLESSRTPRACWSPECSPGSVP